MNNILVMRASGGLSNRLQATIAGVGYCLLTGRALCVDWRDGIYSDDFTNVFPRWFTLHGLASASCEETQTRARDGLHPPFWHEWLSEAITVEYLFPGNDHMLPQSVADSSLNFTDLTLTQPVLAGWGWDLGPALQLAPLLRERLPHFANATDQEIVRRLLVEHIIPAADLTAEADSFAAAQMDADTVGLHIRHTDMKSPLDCLLRTLTKVAGSLEKGGSQRRIFLTTDNKHVEKMVRRLFPRVITREKIYQGDDIPLHCHVPGISNEQKGREALLDMLLLARCQHIIHYSRSSFARIPILLSGLAPEYIHSVS